MYTRTRSTARRRLLLATAFAIAAGTLENTRGNIDYQQVGMDSLGCGDHTYFVGVPLYVRNRSLPAGALDVVGITPDVPVPDDLADPLAFTVRLLARD